MTALANTIGHWLSAILVVPPKQRPVWWRIAFAINPTPPTGSNVGLAWILPTSDLRLWPFSPKAQTRKPRACRLWRPMSKICAWPESIRRVTGLPPGAKSPWRPLVTRLRRPLPRRKKPTRRSGRRHNNITLFVFVNPPLSIILHNSSPPRRGARFLPPVFQILPCQTPDPSGITAGHKIPRSRRGACPPWPGEGGRRL